MAHNPRNLSGSTPWTPATFLAIPPDAAPLDRARVVVVPVPYDGTTSYRGGARDGPRAMIHASRHLEDYDHELVCDLSLVGIHTMPEVEPHMGGPRETVERIQGIVAPLARSKKLVALLGGEHTVAIGAVKALRQIYDDLSVLYLDAHADLRDEYMGTLWGHASVARRVLEVCPLVEVGVRSLSQEEHLFVQEKGLSVFFWPGTYSLESLAKRAIPLLSSHVYISVDLDVFDPSVMAAVGTPEPGGMDWYQVLGLLRAVGESREIVGFDVSELSPGEGPEACAFTAAKLVYKLIGYATAFKGHRPSS